MTRTQSPATTKLYRLLPILLLVSVAAMALTACNTVEGAGKDIESTGKAIQDSADDD